MTGTSLMKELNKKITFSVIIISYIRNNLSNSALGYKQQRMHLGLLWHNVNHIMSKIFYVHAENAFLVFLTNIVFLMNIVKSNNTLFPTRMEGKILNNKEISPDSETKHKQCCIKDLISAKLFFFAQYGCQGVMLPNLNIFMVNLGLSISQASTINGFRTLFGMVFAPLIGMFADYTRKYKFITLLLILLNCVIIISTPWIASTVILEKEHFKTNTSKLNSSGTSNNTFNFEERFTKNNTKTLFILLFVWFTLMVVSGRPITSFLDVSIVYTVKKYKEVTSYGLQRIFAPIGFSFGSFISGVAVDAYSENPFLTKYTAIFYAIAPLAISRLVLVYFMEFPKERKIKQQNVSKNSVLKALLTVIKKKRTIIFIITLIVLGICFSFVTAFLFLLLNEMGASKTAMGLSITTSSLSEVVMFPFSHLIQKKIGGPFPCFIIAVFSYSIRLFLISIITNAWLALPIQTLHAFGFALFWVTAIDYMQKTIPSEIFLTMLTIATSLFYNFGNLIGNVAGGYLYETIGGRSLFQILASLCGVWGIILIIYYAKYGSSDREKDKDIEMSLLT